MGFWGGEGHGGMRGDRLAVLLLLPLAIVLLVILAVFYVLYDTSTVNGDSMLPNLLPEDHLLITRSYHDPHRGDIVIFTVPDGNEEDQFVKRVVGVPGDEVVVQGDLVWVNGTADTSYEILVGPTGPVLGPLTVPEGTVFLLGDNRPVSLDSRYLGPIPMSAVHGRAMAIFAPVTRIGRVDAPGRHD